MSLTSVYRRSEDVAVLAIVVAELEFSDIQRQIFAADLMECADHATLDKRPEALDCLRVPSSVFRIPSPIVISPDRAMRQIE